MERSTELLYWVKYREYIHYSEETDEYLCDPELPERVRISFERWLEHNNKHHKLVTAEPST